MPTTSAGIEYEELPGSPTFSGSRDGPKATRILKIAWSDVDALLGEFFPEAVETGNGWIFPISVAFPGKTALQALDYSVKPFSPDSTTGHDAAGLRSYSDDAGAEVTINYGVPPYDPKRKDPAQQGDEILGDHSLAFSAEMLKLGIAGWYWMGQTTPDPLGLGDPSHDPIKNEDTSLAKLIPTIEHTLTWNYIPRPPFRKLAAMIGCVNADEVLFDAPRGTLLFSGAELKRSYTPQGEQAWKATFKFLQRWLKGPVQYKASVSVPVWTPLLSLPNVEVLEPGLMELNRETLASIGWNHVFSPESSCWDMPFYHGGDGYKHPIYAFMRFASLFDADASDDTPTPIWW